MTGFIPQYILLLIYLKQGTVGHVSEEVEDEDEGPPTSTTHLSSEGCLAPIRKSVWHEDDVALWDVTYFLFL